jgi:hypothetical protein
MATIKLGELLIKANVLDDAQLKSALQEQKKWGGRLGDILVRMGMLTEDLLVRALAKQLNISAVNLDAIATIPPAVRDRIPVRMARDLIVVPVQLKDDNRMLVVAMAEPQNLHLTDQLRAVCNCRISPTVASRSAIERALERFYGAGTARKMTPSNGLPRPFADDLPDVQSGAFKILDSQNQTRPPKKAAAEEEDLQKTPIRITPSSRPVNNGRSLTPAPMPTKDKGPDAMMLMHRFEETQKREVATVRAVVELLIEKGYFTREEYLAKMRR